jgi:hypothetical protein
MSNAHTRRAHRGFGNVCPSYNVNRYRASRRRIISELTVAIAAPALQACSFDNCAVINRTCRQVRHSVAQTSYWPRDGLVSAIACPEFTLGGGTPAIYGTVSEQCAGMIAAGNHCRGLAIERNGDWRERSARKSPRTGLAVLIASPALHNAAFKQRASVSVSRRYLLRSTFETYHLHGSRFRNIVTA